MAPMLKSIVSLGCGVALSLSTAAASAETETTAQVDDEGRDIEARESTRSWKLPKKPLMSLEQVEE